VFSLAVKEKREGRESCLGGKGKIEGGEKSTADFLEGKGKGGEILPLRAIEKRRPPKKRKRGRGRRRSAVPAFHRRGEGGEKEKQQLINFLRERGALGEKGPKGGRKKYILLPTRREEKEKKKRYTPLHTFPNILIHKQENLNRYGRGAHFFLYYYRGGKKERREVHLTHDVNIKISGKKEENKGNLVVSPFRDRKKKWGTTPFCSMRHGNTRRKRGGVLHQYFLEREERKGGKRSLFHVPTGTGRGNGQQEGKRKLL